jgi:hypothetical protein
MRPFGRMKSHSRAKRAEWEWNLTSHGRMVSLGSIRAGKHRWYNSTYCNQKHQQPPEQGANPSCL